MTLVTVTVGTYNSSKFILETLDSISSQSYPNIELIIGDDASSDDTMEKVRDWLAISENRFRFSNVEILEVEKNTGPTANANRKLQVATGEWIKGIGADDTLMPDCISNNMQYIAKNSEVKVLFSKLNLYHDTFEEKNFIKTTPKGDIKQNSIIWKERTAESQYKMLLRGDRIHFTPTVFIHRKTLLKIGGFDERFKMFEDYPLWLKLTRDGHKLHFMDKVTVNYRQHVKAINNTGINYLVNPNYFRSEVFRRICTYPYLPVDVRLHQRYTWYVSQIFKINWLNKDKQPFRLLHSFLTIWLNPFKYLIWLRIKFNKKLTDNEFYM